MTRSRQLVRPASGEPALSPRRRRPDAPGAAVLALQRAAGNRAVAGLLGRGGRPPGIQRLVVRVDDPSDLESDRASQFVKTAEVDRMADYLESAHGGKAISFLTASKLDITAGDHWFAGHGSGADFGGLQVAHFLAKLSFAQLKEGEQATLHLISCNLGNIRDSAVFAKELRRTLQADKALTGRTVIVEAAPAFIVNTAGAKASFPAKDDIVSALHNALEEDEERIDREAGLALWGDFSALLLDEKITKTPPTKKSLAMYLNGMSSDVAHAQAQVIQKIPGNADDYRDQVVAALKTFADAEPDTLLHTAPKLAALINKASPKANAMPLAEAALARVRDRSRELWLVFEEEIKKHEGKGAPKTLRADDPERPAIKKRLKKKDPGTVAEYGWIQYSTKGGPKED